MLDENLSSRAFRTAFADGQIDDEDFAVQIGHAYAHIDRAWNGQNEQSDNVIDQQLDAFSKFPTDLEPLG